jgi:DNA-binding NtrC family response regulator
MANEDMEIESETVTGTILVVDDDEGVRKVLARWIATMGYTVKVAPDAETALEVMRGFQIDVALCDVRMPGHDGIWLVDQMRRFHPSVAVVLATGLLEMDPMVTLRPGVVGYIVKPFNREDLVQVVKRGMAERSRLQTEQQSGPRLLSAGVLDGVVLTGD